MGQLYNLPGNQLNYWTLCLNSTFYLGSSTYRCQKGKEDTREVAEQEATLDQRDYLELRVDFIRLNLFSKPQQEDKDKAIYLTSF